MRNLFSSARLKLTLFYTLTIFLISGVVSGLIYFRTARVIEGEYNRIERRLQMEMDGLVPPPGFRGFVRRIQPEDLARAKHQILLQLLLINGLIVAVVAGAGYLLSGYTLRPIQRSMEEQTRFVGDAAHELRTPITALKTSLEVNLMDKKITTGTKKILNENLDDVINLEHLINRLLKLAKMDDYRLDLQPVQLNEVVEMAVKGILPMARKKQIDIKTHNIPERIMVQADKVTLIDLFTILLDNAVKYSQSKTTVTVGIVNYPQSIDVFIRDQGIGIALDQIEHIFERFYQVDPSRSKNGEGGYGLGLAVAQQIIKQHHGLILVKSEMGEGSTFTVTLPKANPTRSQ